MSQTPQVVPQAVAKITLLESLQSTAPNFRKARGRYRCGILAGERLQTATDVFNAGFGIIEQTKETGLHLALKEHFMELRK